MKQIVLFLVLIFVSFSYAKKFLIKKGDIIDGTLNIGIIIPSNNQQTFQMPYQGQKEKEPPQVYPVSITLTSPQFQNCNAVGELIYNPQFNRFYGNISKISCNENGKIKDYKTKGYILNNQSIMGLSQNEAQPNTPVKVIIVQEVK